MSKHIRDLSLFIAGLPLFSGSVKANVLVSEVGTAALSESNPVSLRPLNYDADNLFAGHRSHSSHASHASHASHYSGSSGGYVAPRTPAPPAYEPPTQTPLSPSANPIESNSAAPATPRVSPPSVDSRNHQTPPVLTSDEKLMRQIMRVQIALTSLKFYDGRISGVLDKETKSALKRFQILKGLPGSGLMTTPTLNALGVPAEN